ncbi:myocardin-related transcription factor A isoform X2 [Microcaecilia unicolor]|uniref:Myocardin-related transcription factor A isoform X2 n=1 Tax=Microcaecilia unicolor TaxID=1415580 RepID=A0A6P7Y0U3_9AMPH|nr:myocardin-related transcription factor A isoform X2 [Microcaecilia unicolor]
MPAHEINIVASVKAKVDFSILLCPPPSGTGNGLDGYGAGENEDETALTALSAPSPQSEAVTNELQELSLQPDMCLNLPLNPNMPPLSERKNVLQLKLQQRRTREELVNQGIMPPLKSPAAFHEQRRSLERARTEDYLKRKIRSRPERSELVRMHILEETSAEPSLQAKQLKLKRARLADDLNEKIAQRPGPMELVEKNILPVESSLKEAIIEGQMNYGTVADSSSFDEDSSDALSPEQPASQDSQVSVSSPLELKANEQLLSTVLSPSQVLSQSQLGLDLPEVLLSPELDQQHLNLTNSTSIPISKPLPALIKQTQPKSASEKSQRSKKAKEPKPKVKKLKYHQYIPPDQKQEKGALPMDSSYAKILQQQQLFLQLQILNQQKQHYNYQTILPAPPKPSGDPQMVSCTSTPTGRNICTVTSSASAVTVSSGCGGLMRQNSSASGGKVGPLPPNLDEMKVAELKQELKHRGLPVSGTKIDLIERLKAYQELNGIASTTVLVSKNSMTTAILPKTGEVVVAFPTSRLSTGPAFVSSMATTEVAGAKVTSGAIMKFGSTGSTPPVSPTPSDHSMISTDENSTSDAFGEMVSSPLTQLTLQTSPVSLLMKEENPAVVCSLAMISSGSKETDSRDKDQMLQEKDKQIEELTRMLKQKQQLVEMLRLQLQQEKRSQQLGPNRVRMASGREQELSYTVKQESDFKTCQLSGSGFTAATGQVDKLHSTTSQMDVSETHPVPKKSVVVKQEVLGDAEMPCKSPAVPHIFLKHLPQLQVEKGGQSKPLKVTAPPSTRSTDVAGPHVVLTVTSPNADRRSLSPQAANMRKRCTVLQRAQSMPTNAANQLQLELPMSNLLPKPQLQAGVFNQPVPKDQKQGQQMTHSNLPNALLSFSAPRNLQPPFNGLHKQLQRGNKATIQHSTTKKAQNSSQPGSPCRPVTQLDLEPQNALFTSPPPNRMKELPGYEEAMKQHPKAPQASRSSSQQMDDLIDILIQSGEICADYKEQPSPTGKEMHTSSSKSCATMSTSLLATHSPTGLPLPVPLGPITTPGRLETFLESATGASLLTADQDGMVPMSLIDDLHSEILSSSAFLDHPLSPMDTSELHFTQESASTALDLCDTNLDSMDWLELSGVPAMSLVPLSTTTPSLFSTDFLDGHDLQLHWDSCL